MQTGRGMEETPAVMTAACLTDKPSDSQDTGHRYAARSKHHLTDPPTKTKSSMHAAMTLAVGRSFPRFQVAMQRDTHINMNHAHKQKAKRRSGLTGAGVGSGVGAGVDCSAHRNRQTRIGQGFGVTAQAKLTDQCNKKQSSTSKLAVPSPANKSGQTKWKEHSEACMHMRSALSDQQILHSPASRPVLLHQVKACESSSDLAFRDHDQYELDVLDDPFCQTSTDHKTIIHLGTRDEKRGLSSLTGDRVGSGVGAGVDCTQESTRHSS